MSAGGRPKTSAISTSRMSWTLARPPISSATEAARLDQLVQQRPRGAGDRDQQHLGSERAGDRADVPAGAGHGDTHHPQVALAPVVVEQGDRPVRRVLAPQHRPDRLVPALAGAEDDRPLAGPLGRP
jgi:hypothetical protein